MKRFGRAAFSAMLLAGAALFAASPARADVGIGFSFGYDDGTFGDPCDYYNYYDVAPPWGLPPDYCEYPVYYEPVYWNGYWYRGPIYYRWYGGERLFWLNGGWRRDSWRGSHPSIRWTDRGGWHGRSGWGGRDVGRSGNRGWGGRSGNRGWGGYGGNRGGGNHRNGFGGGGYGGGPGGGSHGGGYGGGGGGSYGGGGGGGYGGGPGGGSHGGGGYGGGPGGGSHGGGGYGGGPGGGSHGGGGHGGGGGGHGGGGGGGHGGGGGGGHP